MGIHLQLAQEGAEGAGICIAAVAASVVAVDPSGEGPGDAQRRAGAVGELTGRLARGAAKAAGFEGGQQQRQVDVCWRCSSALGLLALALPQQEQAANENQEQGHAAAQGTGHKGQRTAGGVLEAQAQSQQAIEPGEEVALVVGVKGDHQAEPAQLQPVGQVADALGNGRAFSGS